MNNKEKGTQTYEDLLRMIYPDLVQEYFICYKFFRGKVRAIYDWRAFHVDYPWLVINKKKEQYEADNCAIADQ